MFYMYRNLDHAQRIKFANLEHLAQWLNENTGGERNADGLSWWETFNEDAPVPVFALHFCESCQDSGTPWEISIFDTPATESCELPFETLTQCIEDFVALVRVGLEQGIEDE